jgi:hypothetical protein
MWLCDDPCMGPQSTGCLVPAGELQTQGLQQSSIFDVKGANVTPILHHLEIPVRAIVAPFGDRRASAEISAAVREQLLPIVQPGGVWFQNSSMYHATIYHASHHQNPVAATKEDELAEAAAVRSVALSSCPIHAVLERVVATSSGNILACWQVRTQTGRQDRTQ